MSIVIKPSEPDYKEEETVRKFIALCRPSLPPDHFANVMAAITELVKNRKGIREELFASCMEAENDERREGWVCEGKLFPVEQFDFTMKPKPDQFKVREVLPGDTTTITLDWSDFLERHAKLVAGCRHYGFPDGTAAGDEIAELLESEADIDTTG